ncbi:MAG: DNA-directed RNA polymerase subunit A'' [Nanoarchaeota archaeon]
MIEDYEGKIPAPILEQYQKEIKDFKVTKAQEAEILKRLETEYKNAKISPGESIGIITAESFGEPTTQMILNMFHFSGVSELNITMGLPRFIEILDARKTIGTPMMEIYLTKENRDSDKSAKKIASLIKETTFNEVVEEFSINVLKLHVEAVINKKIIKNLGITEAVILEKLQSAMKSYSVRQNADGSIIIKPSGEVTLKEIYRLKEKLNGVYLKGVPGITQVLPVRRGDEYVILTSGTNLKKVLELDEVDITRTISNNIFEVFEVLGIEAGRNAIIAESKRVIEDQGLNVDHRHIIFIADLMTTRGSIRGVTRSGIASEKESVLARASFETTIKHLISASIIGEVDTLNSVIENVMLNQPVPLGTGLPGLLARMKEPTEKTKKK